jgi:hypothetical protein
MLKPIKCLPCSPALMACRHLQVLLVTWLCDATVAATDITKDNLRLRMSTQVETNWLWRFLGRDESSDPLLDRAQAIAAMPPTEKVVLLAWLQSVVELKAQFKPSPPAWPRTRPAIPEAPWIAFKELMEAFYEKGLKSKSGLPYASDGTPVSSGGVTYAQFILEFRMVHRLSQIVGARDVCVLCGGFLGQTPEVDHWLAKSAYPILSVCADNLLPICRDCNSKTNKGDKPVHKNGSFAAWFHPYLRPGFGALQLRYDLPTFAVTCAALALDDAPRVTNLDKLLNLTQRWTREFKAEYAKQQGTLVRDQMRRDIQGRPRLTREDVESLITKFADSLLESEPHYEVHSLLLDALQQKARLAAWQAELGLM